MWHDHRRRSHVIIDSRLTRGSVHKLRIHAYSIVGRHRSQGRLATISIGWRHRKSVMRAFGSAGRTCSVGFDALRIGAKIAVLSDSGWNTDEFEARTCRARPCIGCGCITLDLSLPTAIAGPHYCHFLEWESYVGCCGAGPRLPFSRLCRLCSSTNT